MINFSYIVADPAVLGGKPCIKGTRISVEFILELVASGASRDDVVKAYPQLTCDAVEEALRYASRFLDNEIMLSTETDVSEQEH